jgi:peptidoglycan hydrolase-like protein with peptidoglycan-binding domain
MAMQGNMIKSSVGLGGSNYRTDVQVVQMLLNAVPTGKGGPLPSLDPDGQCGPKTCGAIRQFQSKNVHGVADGRMDPGRATEKALLALLDSLGLLAGIVSASGGIAPGGGVSPTPGGLPGAPLPETPAIVTPTPAGGPNSPIRLKFMSILQGLLPPPGTLSNGQKPFEGAKGTGCGELPGRVFTRVPVIPQGKPGAFKVTPKGGPTLFLTSPTTWWEQMAQTIDEKHGTKTWVPFNGGNRPLPGDIFLLAKVDDINTFQHVGIIVDPTGDQWTTADGGQGNGWQSGFVKRQFFADGRIKGEFGNWARLKGWVDLDALYAVAISAFPANL